MTRTDTSTSPRVDIHADDQAVDRFAAELKMKLAQARAKGRGGWDDDQELQQRLSDMLREHVAKGDPRDVAILACFLWNREEAIAPAGPDAGKPSYQVWQSTDSCSDFWCWDDVDKAEYDALLNPEQRGVGYKGQ